MRNKVSSISMISVTLPINRVSLAPPAAGFSSLARGSKEMRCAARRESRTPGNLSAPTAGECATRCSRPDSALECSTGADHSFRVGGSSLTPPRRASPPVPALLWPASRRPSRRRTPSGRSTSRTAPCRPPRYRRADQSPCSSRPIDQPRPQVGPRRQLQARKRVEKKSRILTVTLS